MRATRVVSRGAGPRAAIRLQAPAAARRSAVNRSSNVGGAWRQRVAGAGGLGLALCAGGVPVARADARSLGHLPAHPFLDISDEAAGDDHTFLILDENKPVICLSAPQSAWWKRLVARLTGAAIALGGGALVFMRETLRTGGGLFGSVASALFGETWRTAVSSAIMASAAIYFLFFARRYVSDGDLQTLRRDLLRPIAQTPASVETKANTEAKTNGFAAAFAAAKAFADPNGLVALAHRHGWPTLFRVATPREIREKLVAEADRASDMAPTALDYLGTRIYAGIVGASLAPLREGSALDESEYRELSMLVTSMERTDLVASDAHRVAQAELDERLENARLAKRARLDSARVTYDNSPARRREVQIQEEFETQIQRAREARDRDLEEKRGTTPEIMAAFDTRMDGATAQRKADAKSNKINLKFAEELKVRQFTEAEQRYSADVAEARKEVQFEKRILQAEAQRHQEHRENSLRFNSAVERLSASNSEFPDYLIPEQCRD
jgi:hypothetical protein